MIVTLVFLDEAGDAGFKFEFGSSRYFAVTLVIFDDPAQADNVSAAIDALRRKLRMPPNREFRFSVGSSNHIKSEFLRALLPFSFRYRALVVDKATFADTYGTRAEERLFETVVTQLFAEGGLQNVTLVMDRIVGGSFEQKLHVTLRQFFKKRGRNMIRQFRHRESRRDTMLQVADMICGAVYRSYTREEDEFRRLIQSKEEFVIEW